MPPKFSLQPVLDYRHNRVEILEVELSRLLQTQQRGLTILEALHDSRGRIITQLKDGQQGDIDLFLISRLRSSLNNINERITKQETYLIELDYQVQEKRNEVISAKQDDEALQTLKEREIERYMTEQAKKENRLQDDIYISRAFRQMNSAV
ncbi:MAG: flagellar export protein FliJ [Anaerolineales bacterium]|nr:flagellar export protein FliJ [Anaerolineales bacterium]